MKYWLIGCGCRTGFTCSLLDYCHNLLTISFKFLVRKVSLHLLLFPCKTAVSMDVETSVAITSNNEDNYNNGDGV